jgi:hypothetical protein
MEASIARHLSIFVLPIHTFLYTFDRTENTTLRLTTEEKARAIRFVRGSKEEREKERKTTYGGAGFDISSMRLET